MIKKTRMVVLMSMYNDFEHSKLAIQSCLDQKAISDIDIEVVVVDDGSSNDSYMKIEDIYYGNSKVHLYTIEHGERGKAREFAIDRTYELNPDYILIIDSDMILELDLISKGIEYFQNNTSTGALVVREIPYSNFKNFYTKVKIFEREVINNAGDKIDDQSIEAARFWKSDAYLSSGGINSSQIAFEEIQPTIRYRKNGGNIGRLECSGLKHDEKKVTLKTILKKKYYYFKKMKVTLDTEDSGKENAFKRWYFFRPVLYRKDNLKKYIRKPHLFLGMIWMYVLLSFIAVPALFLKDKEK